MYGDIKLKLCGEEYGLRPDFGALATVEQIGRPIFDILVSYTEGQYRLMDTVNIIYCCMKSYYGQQMPFTHPEIGSMVKAEGLNNCAPRAAECISSLLNGDKEEKKKVAMQVEQKINKLRLVKE